MDEETKLYQVRSKAGSDMGLSAYHGIMLAPNEDYLMDQIMDAQDLYGVPRSPEDFEYRELYPRCFGVLCQESSGRYIFVDENDDIESDKAWGDPWQNFSDRVLRKDDGVAVSGHTTPKRPRPLHVENK